MNKSVISVSALFIGLGCALFLARRTASQTATTVDDKLAFLVQFGVDGKENVDWSGTIDAQRFRIEGWQFDSSDEAGPKSWKCATRRESYWDTPYERRLRPTSTREKVTAKGIILELGQPGPVRIDTRQGSFSFEANLRPGDMPRTFLNGRVLVSAVPAASYLLRGPDADDYPSLLQAADGSLWVAYQKYTNGIGDQIFLRRLWGRTWSEPVAVTEAGGDYFRTAIAQDRNGNIWVVWAANVNANFDLYARSFDGKRWSVPRRLTTAANSDIFHTMVADGSGNLYLAYQSARAGNFDIYLLVFDGKRWSPEIQVSSDPANDWEPVLAPAPDGKVTILWDTYGNGNYDVVGRTYAKGLLGPIFQVANSGAFESRASAQYDRQGRLWVAWDEGDWNWGKDYADGIPESGRGLLVRRQARVAVLENSKLLQTASTIAEAVPQDLRQVFHQPKIVLDKQGNPWVFFRVRVNLPQRADPKNEASRALWRFAATTYRNGRWSPMMEFPDGSGRIDLASAVVERHDGSLAVAWAGDGRVWSSGGPREQDLRFALIPSGPPAAAPELVPFVPSSENLPASHPEEARDVARVRAYRARIGGQSFRIVRGDLHRHTDLSWDGNRDGSLDDSYRYALDAAGFDYLAVCDHQAGQSIPYNWWRIQKAVDLFTIAGQFAPLYSYERSVKWPNGHRNVFFGERGHPILDVPAEEQSGDAGAAKLYEYLRKFNGVTMSHTSATGMGTDFRDNDPELEPDVEIYQGYRASAETPGAPRAPAPDSREAVRFAAGFVWNAWARGIKLGVQASSDHVSTHVSYADFYVDHVNREAILAAMKARRAYAATDNVVVDLRMGDHFMGESFRSSAVPPLTVYFACAAPIRRVDVIKNNRIVYTAPGAGPEMRFTYTDHDTRPGEAYYYVRMEQQDGQLAWSSPIWVRTP
jgi:hypothetical protein